MESGFGSIFRVSAVSGTPLRLTQKVTVQINQVTLRPPVRMGDILLRNVSGTGVNMISTLSMEICKED